MSQADGCAEEQGLIDINVFYVRTVWPGGEVNGHSPLGVSSIVGGISIVADLSNTWGGAQGNADQVSLHEVTHGLGAHDHNTSGIGIYRKGDPNDLMWYANLPGNHCRIRKVDVDEVRP